MKKVFLILFLLSVVFFFVFSVGCSYNSYYDSGQIPYKTEKTVTTTEYYRRSAWTPYYSQPQNLPPQNIQQPPPTVNVYCNQPCAEPRYRQSSSGVISQYCGCQCSYGYCLKCRRYHCCPDP